MLLRLVLKANELRFLTLHMFIDGHALYCLERALKDCELIAKPAMATFPSLFCRLYWVQSGVCLCTRLYCREHSRRLILRAFNLFVLAVTICK